MSLAQRLKNKRLEMGYATQASLARKVHIPRQVIQKLESGLIYHSRYLSEIAKVLMTTTEYLLSGDIIVSSYPIDTPMNEMGVEILKEFNSAVRLIPIIDWGINSLTRIENMTASSSLPETTPSFDPCGPNVKAFRIKDDSMISLMPNTDSFLQGDVIIIDPDKKHDKGSFVIAEIKGKPELIFRQVLDIAGELFLSPLNPKYDKDKLDDNVKIFGTLIRFSRNY